MTNHQGDESTLILDFDIANSAQTEYCSTFHFPSVPPWPLGPLGPMDHMDNLDILQHLDHSHRSNHFDKPDWSMINQEDNCRIHIVYLVLFAAIFLLEICTLAQETHQLCFNNGYEYISNSYFRKHQDSRTRFRKYLLLLDVSHLHQSYLPPP